MTQLETIFFWTTVIILAGASSIFAAGLAFRKDVAIKGAFWIVACAAATLTIAIASRWIATGHFPLMDEYENSLTAAWLIMAIYIGLRYKIRGLRSLGIVAAPISLIILGLGVMSGPRLSPLTPPYKSIWLYAHMTFSQLTVVSMLIAFGLAVLYLVKARDKQANGQSMRLERLPTAEVLDDLSFRFIIFGYITATLMIITGAIWANHLWGNYWNWDPIETWSLVTWLIYGIYLHTRFSYGWSGRRASWFAIIATISVIINFWGIAYVTNTFHILSKLR
ncbi:MAG: c-type cytochrome biogenesis protein CcsB [Actinomycetota bacterium]|nr:c-type cytochrome biogenesis protein CcsB [Actinomycetota bacterium]